MIAKVNELKTAIEGMCSTTTASPPTVLQQYYSPYNWTSVRKTWMGLVRYHHAGTLSLTIPSVIPSSAREVLIYARSYNAYAVRSGDMDIKVFTQIGLKQYEKYIFLTFRPQNGHSITNDNMWFPMPPNRRIYINVPSARPNSGAVYFSAIGYR